MSGKSSYYEHMPSRNVLKIDLSDSFYHIYARGHSRTEIFLDDADYQFFIDLLSRYLGINQKFSRYGEPYLHLYDKLELICFCLMPNHFHLMVYQVEEGAMSTFMRGLLTSYSKYFNKKYDRTGALFESRYKASRIDSEAYLHHISRYIHMNRKDWIKTPYSSIGYYIGRKKADWLKPERILSMFDGRKDYKDFLCDYQSQKDILEEIKHSLANTTTQ